MVIMVEMVKHSINTHIFLGKGFLVELLSHEALLVCVCDCVCTKWNDSMCSTNSPFLPVAVAQHNTSALNRDSNSGDSKR